MNCSPCSSFIFAFTLEYQASLGELGALVIRLNPHPSKRPQSCPSLTRSPRRGVRLCLSGSQVGGGRPGWEQDVTTATQPRVFFRDQNTLYQVAAFAGSHLVLTAPSLLTSCFHPTDTLGPKSWAPSPASWVFTSPFLGRSRGTGLFFSPPGGLKDFTPESAVLKGQSYHVKCGLAGQAQLRPAPRRRGRSV